MTGTIQYLVMGIILGTVAGISPGPLLTLVVSQTLRFGKKEGLKIAFAPLITDLPIILVSVFLIMQLADYDSVLGAISLVGAAFLIYLAYECLSSKKIDPKKGIAGRSIQKGIMANMLSPHPYLFWFSVGGPIITKSYDESVFATVLFIASFYFFLVGSKAAVAFSVDKSRKFFKSNAYVYAVKFLGTLLLVFAMMYINDAFNYLKK